MLENQSLWKFFFSSPSCWWDNRFNKIKPGLPDFVHKQTKQVLRYDPWHDPPWVGVQLSYVDEQRKGSINAHSASFKGGSEIKKKENDTYGVLWAVKKFCDEGELDKAIHSLSLLNEGGYRVSSSIFYRLIQECSSIGNFQTTNYLYRLIVNSGFQTDVFLGSHLIRLFTLFGSLKDAYNVFCNISKPNVFAWTAVIYAHGKLGQGEVGFDLYCKMQISEVKPDGFAFVAALQACISSLGLKQGKLIHGHILEATLESNIVANALIDLYIKCGSLADAQRIFNFLSTRDVVSWSTLISGYAFYGHEHIAIDLFHQMQYEGILPNIVTWNAVIACYALHGKSHIVFQLFEQMSLEPDCVTFVSLLKTCRNSMLVREVHAYIIQMDIQKDIIVGNTLIDLYAKLGSLADAYKVILMLDDRNAESWSALIAGCVHSGHVYEADIFFHKMEAEGIELHNVAWNALILGYCENGQSHEAVDLYIQMKELGIKPDHVTFLSVLKACSILGQYTTINLIHSQICEWETDLDIMVTNTLIDVYAKMGAIHDACKVFDLQRNRSLVTWNAMISGYAQHGMGQEAFELFQRMQNNGIDPDKFTYASILKACSGTLALDQGKTVHNQVVESGFQLDVYLWSSFIDMYLVCGRHEDAQRLLSEMCANDTVTWNAVIAGCAKYSDYNRALQFFSEMKSECKMDDATYIGLLSACGHQGCVEEGFSHFSTMQCHDIDPTIDHYNCLVDILGRSGCLNEAMSLLESVPFQVNIAGWTSLLDHCKSHGNRALAQKCYDYLASCDPRYSSGYALMSSIPST